MTFNYEIDTTNYREALLDFPNQVEKATRLADHIQITAKVNKVAIIGMGGSALPGDLLKDLLWDETLPVIVVKDFDVPASVDANTLIFVISYSGNTEETIAAYRKITRLAAPIVVITAGGKIEQLVSMYKSQLIKIPKCNQPRAAVGYMTIPILMILQELKLIKDKTSDIKNSVIALRKNVYEEFGKDMATKMGDRIPIIYTGARLAFVGYKWKISFNENAKVMAFCNTLPEANHNEICGYASANDRFFTILFKDVDDDPRLRKRIEVLKELIKSYGNEAVEMVIRGENKLTKILTAIYLGDWTSYYYALAHATDPAPVPVIEAFKDKVK